MYYAGIQTRVAATAARYAQWATHIPSHLYNHVMRHTLTSTIKLDFDLQFVHQFNPPRPLTKRLKFFQFLIKILMCLQIFPANQTLRSQFLILLIFAITVSPRGKLIELKSTKAWLSGIWYPGKQISSGSLTLGSPYQKALILQGFNLPQGVNPPPPPRVCIPRESAAIS